MATCTVQWWNEQKGGDPRTDQAKKGGPRAGIPKRLRPNCHEERYSRTSVGIAPRGGDPKTPVREGDREPSRRGAIGWCRLSRQLLVCGQDHQRGESVDNAFALAEHLSSCPAWRLAPGTCLGSVFMSCESVVVVWTNGFWRTWQSSFPTLHVSLNRGRRWTNFSGFLRDCLYVSPFSCWWRRFFFWS